MTMNEAKCQSAQELISKINYELKSNDIPFLIYLNKQDDIDENEPISKNGLLLLSLHKITIFIIYKSYK